TRLAIESGLSKKDAIKKVAKDNGLAKDDVYKVTLDL
ncbi:MAG: 16S rRNA (cytidine(1402)-2'-O)-methyltransferase, partial [Clostridia bacterium]